MQNTISTQNNVTSNVASNVVPTQYNNQNRFTYDSCYEQQKTSTNKSILDYYLNANMFVNNNECLDSTPPFLSYIPVGIPTQNVDLENELRGVTRNNTRCSSCKFNPQDNTLASNGLSQTAVDVYPNNKHVCQPQYQVIPQGYIQQ